VSRVPINARELLDGYAKPPCKATTINYSLPIGLTSSEINRPNTRQNMTVSIVKSSQTDVQPAEVIEQDSQVENDRPWIVLVWNDPINLMSYVTMVLQKIFGYSHEKATELMLDVHHKGRAVVSSGTREHAEFDVYRLHEHGLWATMQREDSR
jgi:ATP-dependent Clp protease adaptor protein ClpS